MAGAKLDGITQQIAGSMAAGALVLFGLAAHAAEPLSLAALAKPGRVLMLRHANAPGIGDPPEFKPGSGGGTVFELNGSGTPRALGEIQAN